MSFTIFSLIMSILWCDIFTIIIYIIFQKKQFVIHFSVYPVLFLIIISLMRLLLNLEFSFVSIIPSDVIFPAVEDFFLSSPFQVISGFFPIRVIDIFLIIWITGSIYLLCKMCLQEIRFKKYMSQEQITQDRQIHAIMDKITKNQSGKIHIIQTSMINIPMITGLFKPTIYLPQTALSDTEIYNVLLHEWTHYIHKDMWIKLIIKIVCIIYWWNPLIYLLKYDIDNTLEVKNDLYLTSKMAEKEKMEYLQTILKIAKNLRTVKFQNSSTSIGLVVNNKRHPLKQRFDFILEYVPQNNIKKINILLFYVVMFLLFISSYFFVIQPYGEPPKEDENGIIYDINSTNSFITKNKNGTYSLYINNDYICDVIDITVEPFSSLEIIETEE